MNKETRLGLFLLAAVAAFVTVITILGDFSFRRGYYINVVFSDTAGLPDKAPAKIAGVTVGSIKGITLVDGKANLRVWIRKSVNIHDDAQARIIATGIIGTKYLELTTGSSSRPVVRNGHALRGIDPVSLDKMLTSALESIEALTDSLKPTDGKSLGQNLSEAVANIRDVTDTLRTAVHLQEQKVVEIVSNIHSITKRVDSISANLDEILGDGKADLKATIAHLKSISEKLDSIVTSVEAGEGLAGKVLKDKEMGENLKGAVASIKDTADEAKRVLRRISVIDTHWNFSLRYDTKYDLYKPDVGLRVSPSPQKYYYFGGRNLGDKRTEFDPEERNTLDFHVGRVKPYGSIYAGVVKNKGGGGFSIRPFYKGNPWNKFEVYAEGSDFFRKKPVAAANVDVGARVNIYKFVTLGTQVEDIAHEQNTNVYVNLFVKDNDIGYLLGLVGLARP
ncbi:MAG: hypothetical protein CVU77_08995 [Elusimicrobia bacterium HGW-Elusimicrobia-1]|jgi:phospholipid/cholesterol/gamma-HCH transport system substrate-binding protein|nr:MAG: hypothetical protein CVU77_08995 [Elusimicrobia bacterium HGW-Elusimicrobia-1]